MGIIFWMPVGEFIILLRKWLCVYSLAIKRHPGLRFYAVSVKAMKWCGRATFAAGVNSLRSVGFGCQVTFYRHWGSGQGKEGSVIFSKIPVISLCFNTDCLKVICKALWDEKHYGILIFWREKMCVIDRFGNIEVWLNSARS